MKHRWDRWAAGLVEAGWIACVVAIPLLMSPALSLSYTADKVLGFRLLAEALGLIGLLMWLRRPRPWRHPPTSWAGARSAGPVPGDASRGYPAPVPQPLTLAIAASAALMLLATLFGRNFSDGFWGSYLRLFGFFTRVHGWVLFLAVAAYFRTERQWRRLLNAVAFLSLALCAHALIQWRGLETRILFQLMGPEAYHWHALVNEEYRPFATLGNPSFLGTYLVFAIAFALGSIRALPRRRRWAGLLLLGLLTFVLIINQTRGAWLAAAAMGVVYALLAAPAEKRRRIAAASGAIALAFLLFGGVCARCSHARWVTSNRFCLRMAYFFQRDRNSSGWYRLDMWRHAGKEVSGSPGSLLLGYGPESYLLVNSRSFEPIYADGSAPAQFMDSTHNIFADALVEGGLLGLGALVAVLSLGFWTGLRGLRRATGPVQRTVLITAIVALAGYVVQGVFLFDHITTLVYSCLTLGLIAAASGPEWGQERGGWASAAPAPGDPAASSPLPPRLCSALAGAAVALVSLGLVPVNVRAIRAQIWKRSAERLTAEGRMDEAIDAMRKTCQLMPGERSYHVMLAASIVSGASRHASDAEELQSVFQAAEKELRVAIALDPGDVRTYWPLGQLYQYWGVLNRAEFRDGEEAYRHAAALSPRRQWTYWEWGSLELAEGKRAEALARYRYALALDPSVAASQRALAQFYLQVRQPEQAEPLFTSAWRRMAATSAAALSVSERAAEHESLGLAFLAKGRGDKARVYLNGALRLDPQRARAREALDRLSRPRDAAD